MLLSFIAEEESRKHLVHSEKLREIQNENHELQRLFDKMKALSHWSQNHQKMVHLGKVSERVLSIKVSGRIGYDSVLLSMILFSCP